jgi:hypothetical protein
MNTQMSKDENSLDDNSVPEVWKVDCDESEPWLRRKVWRGFERLFGDGSASLATK